ncbi:MAG: helix-turn-helix domain-containing protein [Oscillospiraceae bacterium]
MSINEEMGCNIVSIRKEKRISQEQLALNSDVSVSYLRSIEHGAANPSIKVLSSLAKTLGTSLNSIIVTREGGKADWL